MASAHLYSRILKLLAVQSCPTDLVRESKYPQKKILKSNLSPGSCVICNDSSNLRSMHKEYPYNDEMENYTEMLLDCFNLQLVGVNETDTESEICENCIDRLRNAFMFRKQVEAVDETLNNICEGIDVKNIKSVKIKSHKHNKRRKTLNEYVLRKSKTEKLRKKKTVSKSKTDILLKTESVLKRQTEIKEEIVEKNHDSDINESHLDVSSDIHCDDSDANLFEDIKIDSKPKEIFIKGSVPEIKIPRLDPLSTVCPVCNEAFNVHRSLLQHYPIHFPNFLCDICGKACLNKVSLVRHVNTHSDKRHSCKMCKRTYANRGGLCQHIRKFHRGEKGYCCTVCPERFCDYAARNKHIYEVHGQPCRTYACATCGRVFYRSSRLSEHVKRDHLKQKNHMCDTCDHEFFTKGELKEHMLCHTGVKNFGCEKCGKSFARKKTLTEHLKIHANLRAHECTLCGKAFVQKCTLKGHMRTHQKCDVQN